MHALNLNYLQKILVTQALAICCGCGAIYMGFWLFIYEMAWWNKDILTVIFTLQGNLFVFCISSIGCIVAQTYVWVFLTRAVGLKTETKTKRTTKKSTKPKTKKSTKKGKKNVEEGEEKPEKLPLY